MNADDLGGLCLLLCSDPILGTVMRDPVQTEVGNTYERESITRCGLPPTRRPAPATLSVSCPTVYTVPARRPELLVWRAVIYRGFSNPDADDDSGGCAITRPTR